MGLIDKIKRLYQNLTETLQENEKTLPMAYKNQTKTLPNTTMNSALKTSDFPLRLFVIVGKPQTGKTTLAKNLVKYYNGLTLIFIREKDDDLATEFPNAIFEPNIEKALQQKEAVIVADDLATERIKAIIRQITDNLRVIRHNKQIIIVTHHFLNDIPAEFLKLCDKVIFFHTSDNLNQAFSKFHYVIPKNKRDVLHETLLSLQPYNYIVVKYGNIYGPYYNMDVNPIVGDTNGAEIRLIKKDRPKTAVDTNVTVNAINNTKFMEKILEQIPEFELLTVTEKIITLKKAFPRLKPAVISKIVNTTPQNTWKTLSIARKKGLIP